MQNSIYLSDLELAEVVGGDWADELVNQNIDVLSNSVSLSQYADKFRSLGESRASLIASHFKNPITALFLEFVISGIPFVWAGRIYIGQNTSFLRFSALNIFTLGMASVITVPYSWITIMDDTREVNTKTLMSAN